MPNGGGGGRLTLTALKSFVTCLRIERKMLQEAASRQTREEGQQFEMPAKLFIVIIIVELHFIALC